MKKIVSLFLSTLLICTISVPVLAVNEESEIPVNQESGITDITQFSYIVTDKEGNIKSSGITPNFDSKGYNWSGITLDNGDRVVFRKPDG